MKKVSSVSSLPKAMKGNVPEPVNELIEFSLEPNDFSETKFTDLPDFIKNKIITSPEYRVATHPENTQLAESEDSNDDDSSNLPF